MKTLAVIGAQWGDEGKGKITDFFSHKSDLVVRFQGGNNAGHTIVVGNKKVVTHLVPSGILSPGCLSLIGHGVVFDPRAFIQEYNELTSAGITINPENLKISSNCTVITAYGKLLDACRESKGKVKIGTTGKGIGPGYEDKVSRRGIKLSDLFDYDSLVHKLSRNFEEKEILFKHLYQVEAPTPEQEAKELYEIGKFLKPFSADTFSIIIDAQEKKKNIMFEGAQGVLLDIDYGTYPFVTSSNTTYAGIYSGAGLMGKVDEVVGLMKAYTTRVGEGPFPTELDNDLGEKIRQIGHEFGATTGRKRRCGWLDLPLLKYSVRSSNITSMVLTKLDVLGQIDELKVCVGYEFEGKVLDAAYPGLDLSKVKPIYKNLEPFGNELTNEKKTLNKNLLGYIEFIESYLGVPVGIVSYGPERNEILLRKDYF